MQFILKLRIRDRRTEEEETSKETTEDPDIFSQNINFTRVLGSEILFECLNALVCVCVSVCV